MKKAAPPRGRGTKREGSTADEAQILPECAPFEVRTAPTAVIPFRQAVELMPIGVSIGDPIEGQSVLELACVQVASPNGLRVSLALDLVLEQVWLFQEALVSDLHSTLSLSPMEEIRLELKATQRKLLQQTVLDEVEEIQSSESTIVDKEVLNVARSSSQTNNWNVDGSGSFSLGGLSLGVDAGTSETVTQTASSSAEQMHEATQKSSQNLKTLHKVEVVGLSETTTEERVVRRIRNPYRDRSLTVNVFQLLKRYSVKTGLAGLRPVLILGVRHLVMDRHFVLTNVGFLRKHLLDTDLTKELSQALAAVRLPASTEKQQEARRMAREAMKYLFEVPNIFRAPDSGGVSNNDPDVSYNASIGSGVSSGLTDSVNNTAGVVFTTLNFFYTRFMSLSSTQKENDALAMALALAAGVRPSFEALAADADHLKKVFDLTGRTEALRRLPGFLAMVEGMLRPLVEPAEHEREAAAAAERADFVVNRVIAHLYCHREYYVQRFLHYVATQTDYVTLTEFVRDTIGRLNISVSARNFFLRSFTISRAFIDRSEIVVPAASGVSYKDLVKSAGGNVTDIEVELEPITAEVDVPFDGVHVELAPGNCVLPDVPEPLADIEVGELSVKGIRAEIPS
jgi:hypothetical protein